VILALVGLSFIIFIRYDLTRERHAAIRASLDAARSRSL
jgi:Na+/melibiose symporter-like transporter